MQLTKHASQRIQQRRISPIVIDLLMRYGQAEHAGAGTTKYYFDKASRKRLQRYAGPLTGLLSEHLHCIVAVSSAGEIVTAAHQFKRINH